MRRKISATACTCLPKCITKVYLIIHAVIHNSFTNRSKGLFKFNIVSDVNFSYNSTMKTNLILIGGPDVNRVTAQLASLGKLPGKSNDNVLYSKYG